MLSKLILPANLDQYLWKLVSIELTGIVTDCAVPGSPLILGGRIEITVLSGIATIPIIVNAANNTVMSAIENSDNIMCDLSKSIAISLCVKLFINEGRCRMEFKENRPKRSQLDIMTDFMANGLGGL